MVWQLPLPHHGGVCRQPFWNIAEQSYDALFPKDKLVYLTADSPNTIRALDADKVYIVGGIIDRNRHKGITLRKANDQGISTARLPLDEYVDMSAARVLTTNQGACDRVGRVRCRCALRRCWCWQLARFCWGC